MKHLTVLQSDNVAPDICGPCRGSCCRNMPGAALPSDFGATEPEIERRIYERLATGKWAIDWWEGDPRPDPREHMTAYFLRPATASMVGELTDPSYGGRCVFLGETGCQIFSERPTGCRGLIPKENGACIASKGTTKQDAAIAWIPYHAMLERIIADFDRAYDELVKQEVFK